MKSVVENKHVLLGVTGSIAAYKAPSVARLLRKAGADVKTVMTGSAQKLVGPTTFRALTGNPVYTQMFLSNEQDSLTHISLAEWTDILVVVPATANIIGKIACGIADDLLSTVIMACDCPIGFAPAMNDKMFNNPIVQRNLVTLEKFGYFLLQPAEGELASRKVGQGRLPEPEQVFEWIIDVLREGKNTSTDVS